MPYPSWFTLSRSVQHGDKKRRSWGQPRLAQYVGINIESGALMAFMLSGATAGLIGGLEILGTNRRFVSQFSTGLGTRIVVALLGRTDPLGMIVGAFPGSTEERLFAVERMTNIDRSVALVLQGMILLFISSHTLGRIAFDPEKEEP